MQFRDFLNEETLPVVRTAKQTPEGMVLVFTNMPDAKLDGITPTKTPGQFLVKTNGKVITVNIDDKLGYAIFNKWRASKQLQPAQKVIAPTKTTSDTAIQNLLHWPTAYLPKPPQGWKPEYMEMNSDAAQKRVSNNLLTQGTPAAQAVAIGRKVAEYVWDYSAYPYNVYKRVLSSLSDKGVDDQKAIEMAKTAAEKAKSVHERLKSSGYSLG